MKISKKLLSMVLCGFITFGGVQSLSLIKADAFQEPIKWQIPIRIKLRATLNRFYHQSRVIDLQCTKDNVLQIQKLDTIPWNMTFDDDFIIGVNNVDLLGVTQIPFYLHEGESNADQRLAKEVRDFNNKHYKVGCPMFIHGRYWNDTLWFPSTMYMHQTSNNDYASGYRSRDRWKTGFNTADNGLYECTFMHTSDITRFMSAEDKSQNI